MRFNKFEFYEWSPEIIDSNPCTQQLIIYRHGQRIKVELLMIDVPLKTVFDQLKQTD